MKTKAKVFAVVVVLAMMISMLAACSQTPTPAAATSAPQATTAAPEATATEQATAAPAPTAASAKMAQPVTLTVKMYHAPVTGQDNFANTVVGQYIKDKLNITLTILPSTNESNQMATDFAVGNVPDIFDGWITTNSVNTDPLKKAASEGLIADLTDALNQYAPDIAAAIAPDNIPLIDKINVYDASFGGKIYMLPMAYYASPALTGWGLYIRGDIAAKLNITTPDPNIKTADDFISLLQKIKQGGFTDTNGKPIYPLGMIQPWTQIMAAITRSFDFGGVDKIGVTNGKVSGFIESDYAKNQVLFMRKLIAEGLLDPEGMTQSYETGCERMAQGVYGVYPWFGYFAAQPPAVDYLKTLESTHPEMAPKPLGEMNSYMGDQAVIISKGVTSDLFAAVSAKANVEAAVKLFDLMSSKEGRATAVMGVLGQQWNWNANGFAQMTDDAYKEYTANGTTFAQKYGTCLPFTTFLGTDNPASNPFGGNGSAFTLQNNLSFLTQVGDLNTKVISNLKIVNQLNTGSLMQSFPGKDTLQPVFQRISVVSTDNVMMQCYLAKSDDEALKILSDFVDTLNKSGYQDFLQYVQQQYDANPGLYADYLSEVQ